MWMKQCHSYNLNILNNGKNWILCHFITTMNAILKFPFTMKFQNLFEYIVITINWNFSNKLMVGKNKHVLLYIKKYYDYDIIIPK
jgi:hypothetical protein